MQNQWWIVNLEGQSWPFLQWIVLLNFMMSQIQLNFQQCDLTGITYTYFYFILSKTRVACYVQFYILQYCYNSKIDIMPKQFKKKCKNVFELTIQQKQAIQKLLPIKYSLVPSCTSEQYPVTDEMGNSQAPVSGLGIINPQKQQLNHVQNAKKNYKKPTDSRKRIQSDFSLVIPQPPCRKSSQSQQNELPPRSSQKNQRILKKDSPPSNQNYHQNDNKAIHKLQNQYKPTMKQKDSSHRVSYPHQSNPQLPPDQFNICSSLLKKLKAHRSAWPFKFPVEPEAQGVPDYLDIIKFPMDLKTVEKKMKRNQYQHPSEFHSDINLIFLNSYKYNLHQTAYYHLTYDFEEYYHKLLKIIKTNPEELQKNTKKIKKSDSQEEIQYTEILPKKQLVKRNSYANSHNHLQKTESNIDNGLPNKIKRYSHEDRQELFRKLHNLSEMDQIQAIKVLTYSSNSYLEDTDPNYITIDLETINQNSLEKLDKYFKQLESHSFSQSRYSI